MLDFRFPDFLDVVGHGSEEFVPPDLRIIPQTVLALWGSGVFKGQ